MNTDSTLYLEGDKPLATVCFNLANETPEVVIAQAEKILDSDPDAASRPVDIYLWTAFQAALISFTYGRQTEAYLSFLVERGIDPWQERYTGDNAVHIASGYASVEALRYITTLDGFPGFNIKDKRGLTPAHTACMSLSSKITQEMRIEVLKFMIEYDADLSIKNEDDRNPIEQAMFFRLDAVVEFLKPIYLEKGIAFNEALDVSEWYKAVTILDRSIFHYTAFRGELERAKEIYALNPQCINQKWTPAQTTPLAIAAMNGYASLEYVDFLLESGADVTASYLDNITVLHNAAHESRIDYLERFMSREGCPDINVRTTDLGFTPLLAVCLLSYNRDQSQKIKTIDWLIAQGADLMAEDNLQRSALDLATAAGFNELANHISGLMIESKVLIREGNSLETSSSIDDPNLIVVAANQIGFDVDSKPDGVTKEPVVIQEGLKPESEKAEEVKEIEIIIEPQGQPPALLLSSPTGLSVSVKAELARKAFEDDEYMLTLTGSGGDAEYDRYLTERFRPK